MRKKEIHWKNVFFYALITMLAIVVVLFIGLMIRNTVKYNNWYENLSIEEKLIVVQDQMAEYQANIYTYEVVGAAKYVRVRTNLMGCVIDADICYTFEYIDRNGNLKSVDNFENLEYGLTKVVIGNTDAYIINNNGEATRTLQLTKETLRNLQTLNAR